MQPQPGLLSYTFVQSRARIGHHVAGAGFSAAGARGRGAGPTLPNSKISPAEFEALHRLSPLQRSSTAADVAHAVRFALENRAITGTTLVVDGGQHLMRFERDFSFHEHATAVRD